MNFALIALLMILTLQTEAVGSSILEKLEVDPHLTVCTHLAQ